MTVMQRIHAIVTENPVVIFMKGTPDFPQCGYSSRASQALAACSQPFAHVNVLEDPEVYENLPRYADWQTFPQIYINGELIGGCDITLELYRTGELQRMIRESVQGSGSPAA